MSKKNQKPDNRKAQELEPEIKQDSEHTAQAQEAGEAYAAPGAGGETTAQSGQEDTMQSVPVEKLNEIQEDLEKTRAKADENLEGWRRERAEFMNYRKRVERDQAQQAANLTAEIVKKYLAVLDDMERALKTRPSEGEGAAWSQGVELIYRKLQNILEAEGVQRIPAGEGEEFNPEIHEAISHEENPSRQSGEIIEVVQQGYKIGDRVIRPALVRVAR